MNSSREELVQWLRREKPDTIIENAAAALERGVSMDDLWAAGAITASRYISNQARNLLGFVSHAMIGCEDARQSALGQPEKIQKILLLQALAQVVTDLHDPCFAPYELFEAWGVQEKTVAEGVEQLRNDVRLGEWMRADHRFVGLSKQLSKEELIDLLLDIGLEGIVTDDHTLITPALSLDMMELTGWEAGLPMLRGTLRYSCTFPRNLEPYHKATSLVDSYQLATKVSLGEKDPSAISHLRKEFLATPPADRPDRVARALAHEGASADTVISALSLAACDMYLQIDPVPHQDYDAVSREVAPVHIGTTLNVLRASLKHMSPRTRAIAVVMGGCLLERGPSILNKEFEFVSFEPVRSYPYQEDVSNLADMSSSELLTSLTDALYAHDARKSTACVAAYRDLGAPAEPLISLLVEVASSDDGTLMHNVKHLHSCLEEFAASTHPDRWNFLIAAAKWVSWYAGKNTAYYQRAVKVLASSAA
ncbi:MAG: hypothetical protein KJS67_00595 [Actinomycetales bacterium]|nr:hypothetical protein [Actinomycetales bacterium]